MGIQNGPAPEGSVIGGNKEFWARECNRLKALLQESEQLRQEVFQEASEMRLERDEWKAAVEYQQQQATQLRQQVADADAQIRQFERINDTRDELQCENKELQAQLEAAKNEASKTGWVVVGSHLPNREQLDTEIVRLKNLVELEANQRRELQLQVAPLKVSLEDARRVAKSCEGELAIARHEWQHAQQQVAELQAQLETVRAERDAERSEGNRLFGLCADLRKQVAELRAQLEAAAVTPVQQPDDNAVEQLERVRRLIGEICGWYVCADWLSDRERTTAWEQAGALLGHLQREAG